ncbi:FCD domain-containing protein [Nocardia sp. CC227C]|uniref:FCD domain-containing protein n=1 Tax=Nocardia sp. CC227C TaxID=3044562 RepID=UPI003556EE25
MRPTTPETTTTTRPTTPGAVARPTTETTARPTTAGASAWPAVSESATTLPSPTFACSEQAADAAPRTGTALADPAGGQRVAAGDVGTADAAHPAPRVRSAATTRQPTPRAPGPPRGWAAGPRYDAAVIERELEIWHDLRAYPPEPGAELIAADERFHSRLLAASGNAALADALATVHARVRPIRALDIPTPERIATMTAEHIAIAEHLLAGELDQGLSVLVTHITASRDHVLARAEHALRLTKLARALRD